MKSLKNLLAATILAFAIATTTFGGDIGFPPAPAPPPPGTCDTATPDDGGYSDLLIDALLAIVSTVW
jgi:hypothetical protein